MRDNVVYLAPTQECVEIRIRLFAPDFTEKDFESLGNLADSAFTDACVDAFHYDTAFKESYVWNN